MAKKKDSKGNGVTKVGIAHVKAAGSWCFYVHFNSSLTDIVEWFGSEEAAKARLVKYQQEPK
jgi:hypothetical protein